jgi:hypothetical protein
MRVGSNTTALAAAPHLVTNPDRRRSSWVGTLTAELGTRVRLWFYGSGGAFPKTLSTKRLSCGAPFKL